jgi:F-type H+-transporting ATPase subunit delta
VKRPVTAARRYAEAAFQIASQEGATERWQQHLDQLAALLDDERAARVLANPALAQETRDDILRQTLRWPKDDAAFNLVRLLVRRNRIRLAPGIAQEFRRLVQRASGIVAATVISATDLNPAEVAAVAERVEQLSGRKVELTLTLDPALIGGVAVRIGDRMIDASVRGRLERLRERLLAGAAV